VRLTGCPRGGECHPTLQRAVTYRLSLSGQVSRVDSVPPAAGLPGQTEARRPGEQNYVRFGTAGDTVTARFEPGAEAVRLFWVNPAGVLHVVEGS
ncbi:MAG: hypothetical protein OEO23_06615, partial [Gemmatimonadota bacterium]|nr:hypothetical protein [Gemmatimonadota bacterium]